MRIANIRNSGHLPVVYVENTNGHRACPVLEPVLVPSAEADT
ncbi:MULTISPECIES: hypothetical protein [Paenibacillus]|nr:MULTISPECIES: hypothetical protein [Paenibacillus]